MESIDYKKVSSYYLFGNLFNKGIAFLTVPIFTRILSTSDYGIVNTYTSWISILSMIMGFTLHMGIRAAFIDYREKIDDFMSVTTIFTIVSSSVFALMVIASMSLFHINVSMTLIILCLLQSFSSAITEDYSMYLMMQYKYRFRTVLLVLPNLISTILSIVIILFVVKTDLYMGKIVPTAVVSIVFALMLLLLIFQKSKVLFNKKYLKFGLLVSTPLIVHGISLNILSQSDRSMIAWLANLSQAGIYSLVYNFSMFATVLTTSLDGVWIPWFTEKLKLKDKKAINERVIDYINLMTYAMVCLLLVGPEILKLLASKEYWGGISIIPPVVLANYVIFMYSLYVNVEHFHKKTLYISVNTLIAACINLGLNFILIPIYGYVAAAYTTLIAYFVSFVLHSIYAKKLDSELYPLKTFIRPIVHISITIVIFYALIDIPVTRWIIAVIYFGAMLFKEREKIKVFLSSIDKGTDNLNKL